MGGAPKVRCAVKVRRPSTARTSPWTSRTHRCSCTSCGRRRGPDRHQHRLRHHLVRRLHGAARRRVRQVLHACWPCGRTARSVLPARASPPKRARCTRSSGPSCEEHGLQCGYCTPEHGHGDRLACSRSNPSPTEADVERARPRGQHLCRCTGYHNIVKAALACRWPGADPVRERPSDTAAFVYLHGPRSVDEALVAGRRARRGRQVPGRAAAVAPAADEAAVRRADRADRPRPGHRRCPYVPCDEGDLTAIGALTRHHGRGQQRSCCCRTSRCSRTPPRPWVTRRIEHRGTIGGSVAHADAAADLLKPLTLALDATFVIAARRAPAPSPPRSSSKASSPCQAGRGAADRDPGAQARRPGGVVVPEFNKRAIDFAMVGVAVKGRSVALINMGSTPLRATAVGRPRQRRLRRRRRPRWRRRALTRGRTSTRPRPTASTWRASWCDSALEEASSRS